MYSYFRFVLQFMFYFNITLVVGGISPRCGQAITPRGVDPNLLGVFFFTFGFTILLLILLLLHGELGALLHRALRHGGVTVGKQNSLQPMHGGKVKGSCVVLCCVVLCSCSLFSAAGPASNFFGQGISLRCGQAITSRVM